MKHLSFFKFNSDLNSESESEEEVSESSESESEEEVSDSESEEVSEKSTLESEMSGGQSTEPVLINELIDDNLDVNCENDVEVVAVVFVFGLDDTAAGKLDFGIDTFFVILEILDLNTYPSPIILSEDMK